MLQRAQASPLPSLWCRTALELAISEQYWKQQDQLLRLLCSAPPYSSVPEGVTTTGASPEHSNAEMWKQSLGLGDKLPIARGLQAEFHTVNVCMTVPCGRENRRRNEGPVRQCGGQTMR